MNLNELRDEAYSIAKANGWHEQEHSDEHWLMLIITEIAEAVQADRKGHHADAASFNEYQTYYGSFLPSEETREIRFKEDFEAYIKNTVEDELSDVVIRCLDLAGLRKVELPPIRVGHSNIRMDFTAFCFNTIHVVAMTKVPLGERLENIIERMFVYCEFKNIDIEWFIRQKMNYNRLRGYKHGGKKY